MYVSIGKKISFILTFIRIIKLKKNYLKKPKGL